MGDRMAKVYGRGKSPSSTGEGGTESKLTTLSSFLLPPAEGSRCPDHMASLGLSSQHITTNHLVLPLHSLPRTEGEELGRESESREDERKEGEVGR